MRAIQKKRVTLHRLSRERDGQSGCSAVGSALRSGRRGRAFESPHPDFQKSKVAFKSRGNASAFLFKNRMERKMEILLRKWTTEDRASLMALCNAVDRAFLADRLPHPYAEEDAEVWLEFVQRHEGTDGVFRAIVVDGEVVGSISVERKQDVHRIDGEIGFMLLTSHWNQGIMTKAVQQICPAALKELALNRITASVFEPNIASQHVLLNNGFRHEGTMARAAIKNGTIYDIRIYGWLP